MRADKKMTAVGTGTIDFAALFKLPGASGVRHFYVENDEAPAPYLPDITTSFRNLRALRF
jgi:sugar phosphate isomerase/epimerase